MKDEKVIELIRQGKEEKAFIKLYKYFPKVENFVKTYGGTTQEAKDLFQDAIIIVHEKLKSNNLTLTATVETYLFSVCKYQWKDILKQKNKNVSISDSQEPNFENDFIDEIEYQNKLKKGEKALNAIGERCLHLIKLFYYEGLSMKEIAAKLRFKTVNVAKNQKYKCLERAKKKLQLV